MNMNGQHKRILFMISLPQTAEFETCNENVSECINKLREKRVDICESIHREDLATLNQYDIVIIVAHHDTDDDALLLADGKLSMDDFVNSIPEDFCGELDFSSCYSASAMKAIKDRCPNCHIQASIHQTNLIVRLLAYPYVIDIVNEDNHIEYHDAYMKVLDMILKAASESSESEEEQPEHVKLGNQLSSVYAPSEVKRGSKFMIQLILHYDSESGTILAIAKGHEPDTCWRGTLLNNLCEGDSFSIKIKFDSDNIFVVDDDNVRHNEYIKQITVGKDVLEEQFMVEVVSDYSGSSFWTIISLLKENNWVPGFKFKIMVSDHENKIPAEVIDETTQFQETSKDVLTSYLDIFTNKIFGNYYYLFNNIISKYDKDEEKLFFIRKFVYNNDLFIKHLYLFLQEKENELTNEQTKEKSISVSIVPHNKLQIGLQKGLNKSKEDDESDYIKSLKKFISKLQKKLGQLEDKFGNIKLRKGKKILFEEALKRFLSIEWYFIDMSSEIKYLDYQIDMLKHLNELKSEIRKSTINGEINKIKIGELATQFLEHPHKDHVDENLYNIFKRSGTESIIHPKSQGATLPFFALVLAMVEKEYVSIDNGKEDWTINVDKYIEYRKKKDKYEYSSSLRTPKNRINKLISLLNRKDVIEEIKKYQDTEVGRISITAYYLLKIKISML